jgi:Flp pilus assembly pilin Flp
MDALMRIEYCLIAAVVLVGIIAGIQSLVPA